MILATPKNHRKRRLIDRYLLSPPHFSFNPFKKFKIPPFTTSPRRVRGPDCILKVFGLWSTSSSTSPPPGSDSRKAAMGNLLSSVRSKKASRRGERRADHRRNEGRGLEDVKRLAGEASAKVRFRRPFPPPVSDLRIFAQKDKEPSDCYSYIVNRKVEDAMRLVLEYMPSAGKKAEPVTQVKIPKDLSELFSPLTDEEKNIVNDAMHGGNSHEVLVIHQASNIEITREALQCLSDGGWLNDEVINVYLELLKEREKREPKRFLKCHFFSTFFYKKIKRYCRWGHEMLIGRPTGPDGEIRLQSPARRLHCCCCAAERGSIWRWKRIWITERSSTRLGIKAADETAHLISHDIFLFFYRVDIIRINEV